MTIEEQATQVGEALFRDKLPMLPGEHAIVSAALARAHAEGKAEGSGEAMDLLAEYQGEHNVRQSRRWGIDCVCPLCLRADQLRSLLATLPAGEER